VVTSICKIIIKSLNINRSLVFKNSQKCEYLHFKPDSVQEKEISEKFGLQVKIFVLQKVMTQAVVYKKLLPKLR